MGSRAGVTGAAMKDSNDKPPYRHWHTVCAACGKVTLARPCKVPGDIELIEHNPVVRCQHCEDTRQYLDKDCFLAPLSAAGSSDKSGGTVAVVASLMAAVKLARVESIELQNRSPRVRSAISDSITLARMVIEASKTK
jgi:DNA-directed RNA polymerase subunit RPC12/RpoP